MFSHIDVIDLHLSLLKNNFGVVNFAHNSVEYFIKSNRIRDNFKIVWGTHIGT